MLHGHLTETGLITGIWDFSSLLRPHSDGQLHSLQGSVQNENVRPLVQKAGKTRKLFERTQNIPKSWKNNQVI